MQPQTGGQLRAGGGHARETHDDHHHAYERADLRPPGEEDDPDAQKCGHQCVDRKPEEHQARNDGPGDSARGGSDLVQSLIQVVVVTRPRVGTDDLLPVRVLKHPGRRLGVRAVPLRVDGPRQVGAVARHEPRHPAGDQDGEAVPPVEQSERERGDRRRDHRREGGAKQQRRIRHELRNPSGGGVDHLGLARRGEPPQRQVGEVLAQPMVQGPRRRRPDMERPLLGEPLHDEKSGGRPMPSAISHPTGADSASRAAPIVIPARPRVNP